MGDDSIDMVILDIDMGYLVTLIPDAFNTGFNLPHLHLAPHATCTTLKLKAQLWKQLIIIVFQALQPHQALSMRVAYCTTGILHHSHHIQVASLTPPHLGPQVWGDADHLADRP